MRNFLLARPQVPLRRDQHSAGQVDDGQQDREGLSAAVRRQLPQAGEGAGHDDGDGQQVVPELLSRGGLHVEPAQPGGLLGHAGKKRE